jgi:hypothetical protein
MDESVKKPVEKKPTAKRGRKPKPQAATPKETKVKEVVTENVTEEPTKEVPTRNSREFLVFINGKERYLSKPAIEVARKNYKMTVELPKDSPLVEPALPEPCKDC